jgi:hypothetical protein
MRGNEGNRQQHRSVVRDYYDFGYAGRLDRRRLAMVFNGREREHDESGSANATSARFRLKIKAEKEFRPD